MFHNDIQTSLTNHWKRSDGEHPVDHVCAGHFTSHRQTRNVPSKARSSQYKSATKHIIQRQQVIRSFLSKSNNLGWVNDSCRTAVSRRSAINSTELLQASPRKPNVLETQPAFLSITSISSSQPLIAEPNDPSANNNNRQQKHDRPSPLLVRRHRLTTENPSPHAHVSDLSNVSALQLSLSIPSNLALRHRAPRVTLSDRSSYKTHSRISSPRIKPSKYLKPSSETRPNLVYPKSTSHSSGLLTPIWTPPIAEQEAMHSRTFNDILRTKPHPTKVVTHRPPQTLEPERVNSHLRTTDIQDLHISSRAATNWQQECERSTDTTVKQDLMGDAWDYSKSSNDDESNDTSENSSTATCCSQTDGPLSDDDGLSSSATFTSDKSLPKSQHSSAKPRTRRRRTYNIPLAPVVEHLDEETDLAQILEKISALQKKEFTDDESFTFQLLNQQETAFEKTLGKRRKVPSKQN